MNTNASIYELGMISTYLKRSTQTKPKILQILHKVISSIQKSRNTLEER
ncbi:MAG: hypothetical protein HFJ28_04930 [Clostridia bacterium]|nr:hypothetical protein [Clostridia bacterium]